MTQEDVAPREFDAPLSRERKGLLVVYTGDGKGKSTAAFGAVFRSLGRGFRVAVVQFIKGKWISGEVNALSRFGEQTSYFSVGEGFTWETKDLEKDIRLAREGWNRCLELLRKDEHNVYLFDELLYVLKYRFLPVDEIVDALKSKPSLAHVIVTGRDAPPEIIAIADLVTEMREIRHPFRQGIAAQAGIDY